jgi:hypothetical protein
MTTERPGVVSIEARELVTTRVERSDDGRSEGRIEGRTMLALSLRQRWAELIARPKSFTKPARTQQMRGAMPKLPAHF